MVSVDVLLFVVSVVAVVTADITTLTVNSGDCICATTNVNARNKAGISESVRLTIMSGLCATATGASRRADGYKWFKVTYSRQTLWVAGSYFFVASASACYTPSYIVRDNTSIDDHGGMYWRRVSLLDPAFICTTVILAIIIFSVAVQLFLSCKIIRYLQTRRPPKLYPPGGSQTGMSEIQKSERLEDQNCYAQV